MAYKNKEDATTYAKVYALEHPGEKAAYDRARRENNDPRLRLVEKANRERNKEARREQNIKHCEVPKNRIHIMARDAARRAFKAGMECDVPYLSGLEDTTFTHCKCCCKELDYSRGKGKRKGSLAPSLDRVDNSKGYIKGNVEVICLTCNQLKSNASLEKLKQLVKYTEENSKAL